MRRASQGAAAPTRNRFANREMITAGMNFVCPLTGESAVAMAPFTNERTTSAGQRQAASSCQRSLRGQKDVPDRTPMKVTIVERPALDGRSSGYHGGIHVRHAAIPYGAH